MFDRVDSLQAGVSVSPTDSHLHEERMHINAATKAHIQILIVFILAPFYYNCPSLDFTERPLRSNTAPALIPTD